MCVKSVWIGIALLVACASPTDVCGCSPAPSSAVQVLGTVRDATARPLAGVRITTRGTIGICGGTSRGSFAADAVFPTDSTGGYDLVVAPVAAEVPDIVCLQVVARRSVPGGLDSLASPPFTIAVRSPPLESIRVDLQFP